MPFKIRLKNFQSIGSAEIEVNGFTTIKGPNNTGKSAVLRAFNYLFFRDQDGSSFLKHGETQGEIEVILEDAPDQPSKKILCQIQKQGKNIHYELNGQPLNLIAKKAPNEFETEQDGIHIYSLDFQPTATAKIVKLKPQIAEQFDQKYLLDEDPKITALVLGNANQLTILNHAQKKAVKDKEDMNTILKLNQHNLEVFEKKIVHFDIIPKMDHQLSQILSTQKEIKQTKKRLVELKDQLDTYQALEDQIQNLQKEIEAYCPPEPKICPHCHKEIIDTEGECK